MPKAILSTFCSAGQISVFHLERAAFRKPRRKPAIIFPAAETSSGRLAIKLPARVPTSVPAASPIASELSVRVERMPPSSVLRAGVSSVSRPGKLSTNARISALMPATSSGVRFSTSLATAPAAWEKAATTESALPVPSIKFCQAALAVSRAAFTLSVRVAKPPAALLVLSRIICTA